MQSSPSIGTRIRRPSFSFRSFDVDDSTQAGEFFDRFAKRYDSIYEGKRSKWMQFIDRKFRPDILERFKLTFELFGDLKDKNVLDIGCGPGLYTIESLRRGAARVEALDPAPAMLRLLPRDYRRSAWRNDAALS